MSWAALILISVIFASILIEQNNEIETQKRQMKAHRKFVESAVTQMQNFYSELAVDVKKLKKGETL